MKYACELEIDQPRQKVADLFKDPENAKHWQTGLLEREQLLGRPGEVGAKARLKFVMGKRTMEMTETVTRSNMPDEMAGSFEGSMGWNEVSNRFVPIGEGKTRLVTTSEFRFSGFMKIMAFLMQGLFKAQTRKLMRNFKAFVETGASVAGTESPTASPA